MTINVRAIANHVYQAIVKLALVSLVVVRIASANPRL